MHMDVHKLLNGVMVTAKRQNFVHEIEQGEVASRLSEMGLDMKLSSHYGSIQSMLNLLSLDENAFDPTHSV